MLVWVKMRWTVSLMNFRGGSGKESVSLERWQSIHESLFAMKPSRHWMSQSQIINLFLDLKQELNLSYLFISHDISVIEYVADRVAVMYLGQIVEIGATRELLENPQHPYTKALLAEVPTLDTTLSEEHALKGELPSPLNPPSGCRFHTRCPVATASCRSERPALEHWKGDHQVRCPIVTA